MSESTHEPGEAPDPEIKWAEFPQRSCRQPFTEDGLIDQWCGLPEYHPGPDAAKTSRPSIARRAAWEKANPGWASVTNFDDPFAEVKP